MSHLTRLALLTTLMWLSACMGASPRLASDCSAYPDVPWVALGEGLWVWPPDAPAEVSAENGGHVVTTSVLVSQGEAMLVDPGPSLLHGLRVRQSVECRLGASVRWIVNTHAHSENVLANVAFADLIESGSLQIMATAPTRLGMERRCESCLASLKRRVGEEGMAGTTIVLPTQTLHKGKVLQVGAEGVLVADVAAAHTEGDVVLWWERQRVAWVGGLVYERRTPELAQGQMVPWLQALDRIAALKPDTVIGVSVESAPGKGGALSTVTATRAYLLALYEQIWMAMDEGVQANEAQQSLHLPQYRSWVGYAERHGFNVLRAWRELEPRWMDAPPDTGPPSPESLPVH
ncbi:MBL fold metallo-hydrolase [Hydrogenophaga sp. 5NK40-0174]|uniref:MBL fold metallo-hydrolase n=1 Tax=Hydrogenophaga sp. 5NK40-0174 TaxID=3127649 RepID=UPI00333E852D